MHKGIRTVFCFLPALLSSALTVLLIHSMDTAAGWIGEAAGMDRRVLAQLSEVLVQLRSAEIALAWLPMLLAGAAAGMGLLRIRSKAAFVCLWMLAFLTLTAAGLWLAEVNGVQVGRLASCLLPLLPELL